MLLRPRSNWQLVSARIYNSINQSTFIRQLLTNSSPSLLLGLSNGSVDLQGIQDSNFGTLDFISRFETSPHNIHRVQWNPGDEQFFSMLDNHNLHLVDPVEMRTIDKFVFNMKTTWSEWNPNDRKIVAVCGSESKVRLVDIRSGSSVQTIVLAAKSGLSSHRATRCLWSNLDLNCLIVGDNEGYLHIYDTRQTTHPQILVGESYGQISGMSFTHDNSSIITSQGTDNHLIQWTFDKCKLRSTANKFKKERESESSITTDGTSSQAKGSGSSRAKKLKLARRTSRYPLLSVDTYLRCQFYVTDRHVYCPVPTRTTDSSEIFVYDLISGYRIKTLKSDGILCQGVHAVTGLLPDSLALYAGGKGRLRVWSLDEEYQKKMNEKIAKFHQTRWDSDDEL